MNPSPTTNAADPDRHRIMVVDDDSFMLELVANMLGDLGYASPALHASGSEALAVCANGHARPDLILLDLNMPEMDGVEFVRHLGQCKFAGQLVFLSSENAATVRTAKALAEAHGLRVLGVDAKPISRTRLSALLAKLDAPNASTTPRSRSSRVLLPTELRLGIDSGQIELHYQPKVRTQSGEVVGVEALARWRHPEHGLVPPDEFIPLAESSGLIRDLTREVIRLAVAQAAAWRQAGLNLTVSVNVTMDDLSSLDFADHVIEATRKASLNPGAIVLEVTESQFRPRQTLVLDVLARLRLHRHPLSIDDFGTGHSSLVQLRDLPFDELKVDRSFTHNAWCDRQLGAFFQATSVLSEQLGMPMVAEGVETVEDWNFVRKNGATHTQGYFVSKPMAAESLPAWMDEWTSRVNREELLAAAC